MISETPQNLPISPEPAAPTLTATEAVFEKLLEDIVGGVYAPGARLPAERDLARQLGASRPTLREALRRLGEWNLVVPRRGSGIAVREQSEWMIEVLPAYLRHAPVKSPRMALPQMVGDLLMLRRAMIREVITMAVDRVSPETVTDARTAVAHAWSVRKNGAEFALQDLNVIRLIIERADFLPGLWMINRMSGIYRELAKTLGHVLNPPEMYPQAMNEVLDALEQGDGKTAIERLDRYYAAHDERLMAILEFMK